MMYRAVSGLRLSQIALLGYCVLISGVAVFVYVAENTTLLGDGDGLSGMWLFLVTLPSSILTLSMPGEGVTAIVETWAGGMAQVFGIYVILRWSRDGRAALEARKRI